MVVMGAYSWSKAEHRRRRRRPLDKTPDFNRLSVIATTLFLSFFNSTRETSRWMSRWMNHLFFDRSVGALAPKSFSRTIASQQVNSILPASQLQFNGGEAASAADNEKESSADVATWSHKSGVTAIAIDRFEGKILLSGGADASIKIWSLEGLPYGRAAHSLNPAGTIHR